MLFLKLWTSISPHSVKFYCWKNLFKLLPERKFLTAKIFHFPLKIFVSSKIFEEFAIFEDLRRIFELTKILRIRLQSIFRNQRIIVFVFGPFSIFVATLVWQAVMLWLSLSLILIKSMLYIFNLVISLSSHDSNQLFSPNNS